MPYMGLGLHILVALFFAVHAVRHGRELYWLMILFAFPLLGSVVYFFAVYLPDSRLSYDMRKATHAAVKTLNPGRELREARQAYDLTPTAQNQMRLANALLEAGETGEAVQHFKACLNGPFAQDPDIGFGAARACLQHGDAAEAINLLLKIRERNPEFRASQIALELARAYAQNRQQQEAGREFAAATARFGDFEIRAEYALWALAAGENAIAQEQYGNIQKAMRHWNKHARSLNRPLLKRLEQAFSSVSR